MMPSPMPRLARCEPISFGTIAVAVPPARVFVRRSGAPSAELSLGSLGTEVEIHTFGGMPVRRTVVLDSGTTMQCLPSWVQPATNLAAVFDLARP